MKYQLFTKTNKFRDALRKDLQSAEKSIYIEMYIFGDDTNESHDFVSLLSKKSQEGIEVVLVLDAFGSRDLKDTSIQKMKDAGVEILFFSDRLRRTHRKIIVIDEKISFFGGANIHKSGHKWFDLQIRLRGRKSSRPFLKTLAYTYKMCGGTNTHILHHYRKSIFKKIKTFIIENLPGHRLYGINEYYKEHILHASESIQMTTPYFFPPRWLIALLDNAIRRGVKVEILIPYSTDIRLLDKINYYHIEKYGDLGIDFYAMPQMNHAKMMIIDDKTGVIGSQNLDKLSFHQNFEIGAFFTQKDLVHNLVEIFQTRKKSSKSYKKMDISLSFLDRIFSWFFRLFFYFM